MFQENMEVSLIGAAIVGIILLIWNIFLQFSVSRIKKNQQIMFSGKSATDLEKIILRHSENIKDIDQDIQDLYNISNQIHNLASKSIHKVGVVRFNPFKDLGGDQSFSVALMDAANNGVVISSLHTREGTRVYAKALKGGKTIKHPLTNEEQGAIKKALESSFPLNKKA